MARNLYRFYLYAVFLAMLILAAVGLGWLLQPLLALTPLRGGYDSPPANSALVQGIVFFAVSWIFAILLGGFHYWLIRRDMRDDPDAGNNGIRAFFLNIAELVAAPLGIGIATSGVIANLGQVYSGNLSYPAATAIAALALFVVLELERRRVPASNGVAVFFQRFHLYGVQFILLNIMVFTWISAFNLLVNVVAFGGNGNFGSSVCVGFVTCANGPNLFSQLAAALWVAIFWLGYGWLLRNDASSLFRRIVLALSFAYGVIVLLNGIYIAIALLLRNLLGVAPSPADTLSNYNFSAWITLGLFISIMYLLWLRWPLKNQVAQLTTITLVCEAIGAGLMAAMFYIGIGYVIVNVFEIPSARLDWATSLAFLITGVAYIWLDLRLSQQKRTNLPGAMDSRRGFVFALLGASVLAAVIGGAFALYAVITAALGSPLDNWQHTARIGAAAFIVGAFVLAFYLWRANREQLIGSLSRSKQQPVPPAALEIEPIPAPVAAPVAASQSITLESILDDLLSDKVTRDEAAGRIRELMSAPLRFR